MIDTLAEDNSERVKCCGCRPTQKALLLILNLIAGFFHLALTFTLLITIAFLEDANDVTNRTIGLTLSTVGYVLLLGLVIIEAFMPLGYFCPVWLVAAAGSTLTGLIFLSTYVQDNIKGVFPIVLSTQYNHPPTIPPPFDSNVIDFTNFPANFTVESPCKMGPYAADEYTEWFQCIRKSDWKGMMQSNKDFFMAPNGRMMPKGNYVLFEPFGDTVPYLWWGVVLFCVITTLFHFILAWGVAVNDEEEEKCNCRNCSVPYYRWIINGRQPLRWAEYSITASIMVVLVLVINRVTDIYQIIYSFIVMELINSFGAGIDYVNNPVIVLWFWFCSGTAFAWQFVLIFNTYFNTIKPYVTRTDDFTADELWGGLFGFITPLNFAIFASFSSFAVVNVVHQCARFKGCFSCKDGELKANKEDEANKTRNMFWAEVAYITLSFISKGLLVIIVSVGATARDN